MRGAALLFLPAAARGGGDGYTAQMRTEFARLGGSAPSMGPAPKRGGMPGYFLRNMTPDAGADVPVAGFAPAWLDGHSIYRIAPGEFPENMTYHYDGLAAPMVFRFGNGRLKMQSHPYHSTARDDLAAHGKMTECIFMESGTGPWLPDPLPTLPPLPPLPPAATCAEAFVQLCNASVGSAAKCAACELTHRKVLNAAGCTEEYKAAFCALPKVECMEEFMMQCGATVLDSQKCGACTKAHATELADCNAAGKAELCTAGSFVPPIPGGGALPPGLTGTLCMKNPAVNPFPINGQLWLTIDTPQWGRIDPETLETMPGNPQGSAGVRPISLNAHPACDHTTGDKLCYVSYPCTDGGFGNGTVSHSVCIGIVVTHGADDMQVVEISRAVLPDNQTRMIQHSHAPCMSRNFLIVKIDSFEPKVPNFDNQGMLMVVNQKMDNLWIVMDRRDNTSRILSSGDFAFVNNHFGNCVEDGDDIIVDTAAATNQYLNNYFVHNLVKTDRNWTQIMMPPRRCRVPQAGDGPITCEKYLQPSSTDDWDFLYDFTTYNPLFKGDPASRWWYATAPLSDSSLWMDQIIKGDMKARRVVARWHEPGVYTTEANFIPRPGATAEDDGVLFSLLYNSTRDETVAALFDAQTMALLGAAPLGLVVPYHSHGVLCKPGGICFANP